MRSNPDAEHRLEQCEIKGSPVSTFALICCPRWKCVARADSTASAGERRLMQGRVAEPLSVRLPFQHANLD